VLPPLRALRRLHQGRVAQGGLEERLAYRATGLLAVTLHAAAPWFLAQSFPRLASTIHGQDDALDCLAAVTVAGARGKEDVERSIKAVWDLVAPSVSRPSKITGDASAAKASPQVLAAAVSTWAFFITTIVSVTDAHRKADWNAAVASLAGLLDNDDRAVRMAAGEALAVCVELNLMTSQKGVDALAAKVSELASEAPDRGSNNAMLPEQKDLFREIAAFLDRGERPEKSMPTSQDGCVALEVSTWAKHVQLKFLTRFLGNGFVKHVQGNELFVEAFSYGADEGKVLSIANKKQSSNVDKDLELKRDWSWRHCNIFCRYPYTANRKPESLLQIGWQAPNYKEQKNR
jgi:hypothetical protein